MNSAKLNEWMQLIGIFALVLSLVFVGLQMRQTQEIAKATLYQMRSDSSREVGALMVENPTLIDIYTRAYESGIQSLEPGERRWLLFSAETMLGHFENSHHLYQLGFLTQEQWEADRRQIKQIIGPFSKHLWTTERRQGFRESFAEEIDSIVRNLN